MSAIVNIKNDGRLMWNNASCNLADIKNNRDSASDFSRSVFISNTNRVTGAIQVSGKSRTWRESSCGGWRGKLASASVQCPIYASGGNIPYPGEDTVVYDF